MKAIVSEYGMTDIITDVIIEKYEQDFLRKVISDSYGYYTKEEQEEILDIASKNITLGKTPADGYFKIRRRAIIHDKVKDYLKTTDEIELDAFTRFRLKDYVYLLEEVADRAADEFAAKREYNEFIRLLRYFVEIQQPKYPVVHIVSEPHGFYSILNSEEKDITFDCANEFMAELAEGANLDDILMSSLITMAPRKIILHRTEYFKNEELLETIKRVFPGKVIICSKCHLCGKIQ